MFLDSARRDDWNEWLATGLFYGVTTNPTLLAAAGIACTHSALRELALTALDCGSCEVHLQTWGQTAELLLENGLALAAIDRRVVVKVPLTRNGLTAINGLRANAFRTTATALYAAHQALTAAVSGVDYAAPYLGRISDGGRDGYAEVVAMYEILRRLGSPARLLVASIRSAGDLARLAQAGLDTYTFGPNVAAELFAQTQTLEAATSFDAAARSTLGAPVTSTASLP